MLKKFFHPVLVVSLLAMGLVAAACSDSNDDGPKSVELTGGTSTEQTVYADETQKPESITFKAVAPWTATVTEVATKAEAGRVDWLTLSAYSGEAGDVSLTMTLKVNTTGHDRKAEIRIICGDTTIVITVEQKATKADRIKRIEKYNYNEAGKLEPIDESYEFTYDEETGRVKTITRLYYDYDGYDDMSDVTTVTYEDGSILYEYTETEGNYTKTDLAVLDEYGRVVSDKITEVEKYGGNISTNEETNRFTYKNGYLVKTETTFNGSYNDSYEITWENGNPTQVIYTSVDEKITDRATYGSVENKANLDLNWFIALDAGEWIESVGENQFLAAMGYVGKRSKNMAEQVIETDENEKVTFEYKFDKESRIEKIIRKDEEDTDMFMIHYVE